MRLCLAVGEGVELDRACAHVRAGGGVVECARSAEQAAARLAASPTPELVLVGAPDAARARALVAAVRGQVRGAAAPVVALVPGLDAAEAALDAGAGCALPAPFSPEVLAATLTGALRAAARARDAAGPAPEPGLEVLFEKNPHPMWFFDVDTLRFLAVNDAAVAKYGFAREEFLAMTLKDIRPPEEVPRLLEATTRTSPVPARTVGWRHRAKDGRIFHVEIIASPVVFRGRACELVLPHDVTDREEALRREEELRAQLAAQDRMASIGTLAAAVAHEVNNPLTWVLANVAWLEARAAAAREGDEARAEQEAVREIGTGLRRIHALVRDLHSLSIGDEGDRGPCDVVRAVRGAISIAASDIRLRAALTLDLPEGLPAAAAGEARLGQVVLNLVANAAQAIPPGDAARNVIRVAARVEAGRIVLEVADSGTGIAPEALPRIYEPFFTTKPGEGSGIGLWIVRRILGPIGGTIDALPRSPRGTVMRVTLPVATAAAHAPGEAARAEPPSRPERPPATRPRLLVVDDEPLVGRAMERLLRDTADVAVESSGRAAVARLAAGERFDVVLCDVMMPELSAPDLHAEVARIDPAAAAAMVFMTGGAFTPREQAFLSSIPNRCLEKPLDLRELRALLRARSA